MKIHSVFAAFALSSISLAGLAGCGAAPEQADAIDLADEATGSTEASVVSLAQKLAGTYVDDSGAFKTLTFAIENGRKTFVADTGIRCITTPCPSSVEGRWSVRANARGKTFVRLDVRNVADGVGRYDGEYAYELVGGTKLVLSRRGFQQSLARVVACEERTDAASCAEDPACELTQVPYPCPPGRFCPAVMVDRCVTRGSDVACESHTTEQACAEDARCTPVLVSRPCPPGMMCPAVMTFERCADAGAL